MTTGLGYRHPHVPMQMVGAADRDHVQVVAGQQVAPVSVQLGEPVGQDGPLQLLTARVVTDGHEHGSDRKIGVVRCQP